MSDLWKSAAVDIIDAFATAIDTFRLGNLYCGVLRCQLS